MDTNKSEQETSYKVSDKSPMRNKKKMKPLKVRKLPPAPAKWNDRFVLQKMPKYNAFGDKYAAAFVAMIKKEGARFASSKRITKQVPVYMQNIPKQRPRTAIGKINRKHQNSQQQQQSTDQYQIQTSPQSKTQSKFYSPKRENIRSSNARTPSHQKSTTSNQILQKISYRSHKSSQRGSSSSKNISSLPPIHPAPANKIKLDYQSIQKLKEELLNAWRSNKIPQYHQQIFLRSLNGIETQLYVPLIMRQIQDLQKDKAPIQSVVKGIVARQESLQYIIETEQLLKSKIADSSLTKSLLEECVELLHSLRILSLNAVECIVRWRERLVQTFALSSIDSPFKVMGTIPYMWADGNYLIKIKTDGNFLHRSAYSSFFNFSQKSDPFLLIPSAIVPNRKKDMKKKQQKFEKWIVPMHPSLLKRVRGCETVIIEQTMSQHLAFQSASGDGMEFQNQFKGLANVQNQVRIPKKVQPIRKKEVKQREQIKKEQEDDENDGEELTPQQDAQVTDMESIDESKQNTLNVNVKSRPQQLGSFGVSQTMKKNQSNDQQQRGNDGTPSFKLRDQTLRNNSEVPHFAQNQQKSQVEAQKVQQIEQKQQDQKEYQEDAFQSEQHPHEIDNQKFQTFAKQQDKIQSKSSQHAEQDMKSDDLHQKNQQMLNQINQQISQSPILANESQIQTERSKKDSMKQNRGDVFDNEQQKKPPIQNLNLNQQLPVFDTNENQRMTQRRQMKGTPQNSNIDTDNPLTKRQFSITPNLDSFNHNNTESMSQSLAPIRMGSKKKDKSKFQFPSDAEDSKISLFQESSRDILGSNLQEINEERDENILSLKSSKRISLKQPDVTEQFKKEDGDLFMVKKHPTEQMMQKILVQYVKRVDDESLKTYVSSNKLLDTANEGMQPGWLLFTSTELGQIKSGDQLIGLAVFSRDNDTANRCNIHHLTTSIPLKLQNVIAKTVKYIWSYVNCKEIRIPLTYFSDPTTSTGLNHNKRLQKILQSQFSFKWRTMMHDTKIGRKMVLGLMRPEQLKFKGKKRLAFVDDIGSVCTSQSIIAFSPYEQQGGEGKVSQDIPIHQKFTVNLSGILPSLINRTIIENNKNQEDLSSVIKKAQECQVSLLHRQSTVQPCLEQFPQLQETESISQQLKNKNNFTFPQVGYVSANSVNLNLGLNSYSFSKLKIQQTLYYYIRANQVKIGHTTVKRGNQQFQIRVILLPTKDDCNSLFLLQTEQNGNTIIQTQTKDDLDCFNQTLGSILSDAFNSDNSQQIQNVWIPAFECSRMNSLTSQSVKKVRIYDQDQELSIVDVQDYLKIEIKAGVRNPGSLSLVPNERSIVISSDKFIIGVLNQAVEQALNQPLFAAIVSRKEWIKISNS